MEVTINSVPLVYQHMPDTHSVALGLYLFSGSAYEDPDNNGISHFLEHLHFRKAQDWSQERLYQEMDKIGGELRAATYREFTRFYIQTLPENLVRAMEIPSRVVQTESWNEEELKAEKAVVIREIQEPGR